MEYDIEMRLSLAVLAIVTCLCAQEPPKPPGGGHPMPEPKNLKVLKVPSSELIPIMRSFSAALGQKCNFCHVQGDFASDEKEQKEIARKMITMTHGINANFPDGKMHVTCYTCHRGDTEPKTAPPPAAPAL